MRLLKFLCSLINSFFECRLIFFAVPDSIRRVALWLSSPGCKFGTRPSHPDQKDLCQHKRAEVIARERGVIQHQCRVSDGVQRQGGISDPRRIPHCTNENRKKIIKAKWAVQTVIVITQQRDEDRFHPGNQQRPLFQKYSPANTPPGIEQSVEQHPMSKCY